MHWEFSGVSLSRLCFSQNSFFHTIWPLHMAPFCDINAVVNALLWPPLTFYKGSLYSLYQFFFKYSSHSSQRGTWIRNSIHRASVLPLLGWQSNCQVELIIQVSSVSQITANGISSFYSKPQYLIGKLSTWTESKKKIWTALKYLEKTANLSLHTGSKEQKIFSI